MKPTFALDLTREAIGLLHRTPKGWLSIGEVAFDAPDLAEALDYLRKTALGLSPLGVATKLILPNSQILYTEIHAPGPSRDDKRRQIAAALEGRTPYDVDDLVFDWSGKGATVKVAVIAKETLAEAEGFAVEHRLNPVSFVAVPEEGQFVGEPWFGPTQASAALLAEDETVERDREPVAILHRELPKAEPAVAAAPPAEEETLPGLDEALNAALPDDLPPSAPPAPPEPLTPDIDAMPEEAPQADLPWHPVAAPVAEAPAEDLAPATAAPAEPAPPPKAEPPAPSPPPATLTPEPEPVPTAPAAPVAAAPALPAEADEAPFAHVTDTAAFPEADEDLPPARKALIADDPEDDIPPAPPSAAMVAFASRRAAAASPIAAAPAGRPVEGAVRPQAAAAATGKAPVLRPAPAKGLAGLVTAPSIPGTRAKPKGKTAEIPRPTLNPSQGPTTVKSPARPGGTFGAAAPAKKRSGTVFMVLVALLLLFLALVGAWSSLYLGGDSPTTDEAAATDAAPGVDDEMLADMQDPEGMTEPLPEADLAAEGDAGALATESLPVNIGGEPETATDPALAEPALDPGDEALADVAPEPVPEPAPDTVVATDVSAATAPAEDQDEIFLSAMDAPPPALDALALPALADQADVLPDPPMPPPVPGTVYQFLANGLLKATPEGIVSPDGVFLIAGKPPVLPPARSEAAAALAAAAAAAATPPAPETAGTAPSPADASLVTAGTDAAEAESAAPVASDPAMAGFRPRPRPETLVPAGNDDAQLAPAEATEFAGLRPLPRPASVLAAAAAAAPAPTETAAADLGAQGASLTAQAEAKLAEAAALEAQDPSIVAISMRPASRPRDFSNAVEAAVAAAVREPPPQEEVVAAAPEAKPEELDELNEPDTASAAPSIPTKASVAKQATYANAINLSKISLIGTYGTESRRYALVRQSNGKYKKVKLGDKIDGGTVKAITETEVRYQKGGKLLSLKMPKA